MAYEAELELISLPSGADYSAGQYRGGTVNSSGQVVLASAGARIVGVVQNKPVSGESATIAFNGISKMEAGAAVAAGAQVAVDAAGRGVTATTGNYVFGIALEAAGASGVYFPILVTHAGLI